MADFLTTPIELPGSGEISKTQKGKEGTRSWKAHASYVYTHADLPSIHSSFNTNNPNPDSSNANLICTNIKIKPDPKSGVYLIPGGGSCEAEYFVTAQYNTASWVDTMPKESYDGSFTSLVISDSKTRASDGKPICSPITIIISTGDYKIDVTKVYASNTRETIAGFEGKVNAAAWKGFAAETLLLVSFSLDVLMDYDRLLKWDKISYHFKYNSMGWQNYWEPGDVARDTNGHVIYQNGKPVVLTAGHIDRAVPDNYSTATFGNLPGL